VRALTKTRPGPGVELTERPEPVPGPGEVLVRVRLAGICGTDLSTYDWQPYVRDLVTLPRVLGHEFVGVVEEAGPGTAVAPGTRVTADTDGGCGRCAHCRRALPNACERQQRLGSQRDGGLAELVTVPERSLHAVPDAVPDRVGCLLEPFAAAVHAVELLPTGPGGTAAVVGPGSVGLLAAVALRDAGAGAVLVAGLPEDAARLAVAERLGFEPVQVADAAAAARRGPLSGLDAVVDAVGSAATLGLGVRMLRFGGHLSVVGLGAAGELDVRALVAREAHVHGSWRRVPASWDRTLALAARHPELAELVSDPLPLSAYEEAFAALRDRRGVKTTLAIR
jgi:threonine dehydrogenase-like Zn-dependent dehydrogenase